MSNASITWRVFLRTVPGKLQLCERVRIAYGAGAHSVWGAYTSCILLLFEEGMTESAGCAILAKRRIRPMEVLALKEETKSLIEQL